MRAFADFATRTGLARGWFFVRYADPGTHLRIRFHGDPATLLCQLMPQVCEWAGQLIEDGVCSRFAFDTYEREVERYGGLEGIGLAERIFMADSCFVADMLHATSDDSPKLDPLTLAILSTDQLLVSLGLSEPARATLYGSIAPATHSGGCQYRLRKQELRQMLSSGDDVKLHKLLATRSNALAGVGDQIIRLDPGRHTDLYRSYVHMHFNRILGTGRAEEQLMLELLRRTRHGLGRSQGSSP